MRGSILINFDEIIDNFSYSTVQVYVNGDIRKIISIDTLNQYSTYVYPNDVVQIILQPRPITDTQILSIDVSRIDYTTDDLNGNNGIYTTSISSNTITGTTSLNVTFTATTRSDAYGFNYVATCNAQIPCYSIGSGYTNTTTPGTGQPAVRDIKLKDNLIYTVGNFNRYNGIAQSGITITNLDGSLYSGFTNLGCNVTLQPRALEVLSDGKFYVTTSTYGGVAVRGLVRINPDGTRDTSFSGLTSNNNTTLDDIEIQSDGKIICVGAFTLINGTSRQSICRLNTNGSLDTSFGGVSGFTSSFTEFTEVYDIDIQSDGKILCVGQFGFYSGVSRNSICRLNNDGTLDTSFTSPFTNPNLYTLVVKQLSSGKILVGGDLEINGTYYGLVRLNSNGTLDTSFPYFGLKDRANDVEEQLDGKILVSTYNSNYAPLISRLFRINSDGSIDSTFNQLNFSDNNLLTSEVIAINEVRGLYYFGGGFETVNGQSYNHFVSGFLSNGDLNMCS